ncbi:MAG: hypothetical protein Q8L48_13040 [Archangium sp.]|nr:hypothetical protein [Archangium sp.]
MKTMLVLRQLTAVLDRKLAGVTRPFRLAPTDALLMGWMVQRSGLPGSNLADLVGRSRQSVQRSLERLLKRGLIQK